MNKFGLRNEKVTREEVDGCGHDGDGGRTAVLARRTWSSLSPCLFDRSTSFVSSSIALCVKIFLLHIDFF